MSAFEYLSGDRNPLHVDAIYAQRTPYGEQVVYGMLSVLSALGAVRPGKFRLRRLHAVFKKPIYLYRDYDLDVRRDGDLWTLNWIRGDGIRATISAIFADENGCDGNVPEAPGLSIRSDGGRIEAFQTADDALAKWIEILPAGSGRLDLDQMLLLLWTSTYTGMEFPGESALLSEVEIDFADDVEGPLVIQSARRDERFRMCETLAAGAGADSLRIVAFERADPVRLNLARLQEYDDRQNGLAGKSVLVTGASRGFGAALAAACGLQGARLWLTYRSMRPAMDEIAGQLDTLGVSAEILQIDLAGAGGDDALSNFAAKAKPDLVFANAFSSPYSQRFREQPVDDVCSYVNQNLRIAARTLHAVLPAMADRGIFVNVSSIYAAHPAVGFGHYVAAKSAVEGLIKTISLETPDRRFVNARLPRMRTDQTNSPYDPKPAHPAEVIAWDLVGKIRDLKAAHGCSEFEIQHELPQ